MIRYALDSAAAGEECDRLHSTAGNQLAGHELAHQVLQPQRLERHIMSMVTRYNTERRS